MLRLFRKSYEGWRHCARRSRYPLPLVLCGAWLFFFLIFFVIVWTVGWEMVEWRLVGSVSSTYPEKAAIVTLVTGKNYVRGARVLAHSLKMHNLREYPLIALVLNLSTEEERQLTDVGWEIRQVEPIPFFPPHKDKKSWWWVPEQKLGPVHVQALTKMRIWEMDEFERLVFIDSDAWAVGDVTAHLCRRTEEIVGMGNMVADLNSGVMSLRPDKERFKDMMSFWENEPDKFFIYHKRGRGDNELPNPDQSLLIGYCLARNIHIGPLSSRYNLNGRNRRDWRTRIVHFNVDIVKPWNVQKSFVVKNMKKLREEKDYKEMVPWEYVLEWLEMEEKINEMYPL
jgi:hypothetical protein